MAFDINQFNNISHQTGRYEKRLDLLKSKGRETQSIEKAVMDAIQNIKLKQTRSFVIYGEPQSGKTEMMIALTAKLLDEGHKIIIHLLNDNVELLQQNLERFQRSGLSPAPYNYTSILDSSIEIGNKEWVIFCKKNAKDLSKLIEKINHLDNKIIIDDEADYASPNSKINQGKISKINELIRELLKDKGIYIGVTATPARLDLNSTFENDHEKWVDFPIHSKYTGQDVFFPVSLGNNFKPNLLPDTGDKPEYCRDALFRFLINAAYLNLHPEIHGGEQNYTFLVHTSGKKVDHKRDYEIIQKVFGTLSDKNHKDFATYVKKVWDIAQERYGDNEATAITQYILKNAGSKNIVIMNSDKDVVKHYRSATVPATLFTIVIGGNIVSRGITFENLLSMYFTRDVKQKMQQDTYIQRARMFGSRGDYLQFFELTIPENLYLDWHRCFIFHRLSLEAIRSGKGAPVWLEDKRVASVAKPSIDKANVYLDSGEMSYGIFDYGTIENQVHEIVNSKPSNNLEKLKNLQKLLGEQSFPEYVISYIEHFVPNGDKSIMIHTPHSIVGSKEGTDQENISRKKGFMGGAVFTENKDIMHHIRISYNAQKKARLFYKYNGKITFLKKLTDKAAKLAA